MKIVSCLTARSATGHACDRAGGGELRPFPLCPDLLPRPIFSVTYVDIEGDAPRSAIGLACRRDERSPAIKKAMRAARLAKLAI